MATLGLNKTGKAGEKEGERKGKDRKITKFPVAGSEIRSHDRQFYSKISPNVSEPHQD